MKLHELSIHELHELLKLRKVSSVEATRDYLAHIDATEPKVHSFITRTSELALAQAKSADAQIAGGRCLPLTGVPIALKDIFLTEGVRTTCASKILADFIPPYTATSAKRMLEQGSVLLGKLNMDEFAMGSSTETSHFGKTLNPWNVHCVPGGSSGGSAAAIAADQCAGTLGTDTGGSIRQPASLCGIVGIKPTYGRVSRYGVIAFASSLDQVGPMTKDVTDAAWLLKTIAGRDPMDSTSLDIPVPDYTAALTGDVKGMRIGLPKEYFGGGCEAEVDAAVSQAARLLEKMGARLEEISLPHTEYAVPTYYILAPAEASSNLARYDGVRFGFRSPDGKDMINTYKKTRTEGFGAEVKRRIMLGTYVLSAGYYDAYYLKAQKVRTLIRRDFEEAFRKVDVILTPVSPSVAWKIGDKADDPLKMYLADIYTINVNLAGLPGLALPCGFSKSGLPIGMQLIGAPFKEENLFRLGFAYEQQTEWHKRKPPL